jgi:hypothetical protein
MASGKRTDVFLELQNTHNIGISAGKVWKLVLDGGIRWNASYSMIRRALELREALNTYAAKLKVSKDSLDQETFDNDYLTDNEWEVLEMIKEQLEPLFLLTKSLEGNADLKEGAQQASHGALWEILPVFDHVLSHFETLQLRSTAGDFNHHEGIQSSITLAWNKAKLYYNKTDESIAWIAATALHPRFKWQYFQEQWQANAALRPYLAPTKSKFKRLWENKYKSETIREGQSPEPELEISYLERILNERAPAGSARPTRPSPRRDQFVLYLEEAPNSFMGVMEYWRSRERDWPELAQMAYDFLAIPAMSSECERVFSSCSKQTTAQSSRLSGETLWHQECLKNWSRRGAIEIGRAFNGIVLNL